MTANIDVCCLLFVCLLVGWLVGCLLACLLACLPACLLACLLACSRFFAEHASLQSTLLCRARSFAEHSEHAPLQSTLLCRALSFAEHASLQSTLLCRARSAEHSPLQSRPSEVALQARSSFAKGNPFSLFFGDPFFGTPACLLACLRA